MNVRRLVVASQNPDKIREVEQVLETLAAPPEIVRGLEWAEVEETESTLVGNALLKARFVARETGIAALADDTGLEVDALDGAPGVRTARFAGEDATYADNVAKLLSVMKGRANRAARFRTAVALVDPDGDEVVVQGSLEGGVADEARGNRGFGYDPVFALPGGRTLAEVPAAEKNLISHRARALHALVEVLAGDAPVVDYRLASLSDAPAIADLLVASGWGHRVSGAGGVEALIAGATRCVTAWRGPMLVGFGRVITDDVSNGYLSMLVVADSQRRQGIGTRLVKSLIGSDPGITWVLRAGGGTEFWESLGFSRSEIAYERVRSQPGELV